MKGPPGTSSRIDGLKRNADNRRWSLSRRNTLSLVLGFVCYLLLVAILPHVSANLDNETSTLLTIKKLWGSPAKLSGWSRDLNTCSWSSVVCDIRNTTVTSLLLKSSNVNVNASLPDIIGDLVNLKNLTIQEWGLIGEIPASIARLKKLKYLNLQSNNCSGSIPPAIGNLTNMQSLDLGANKLNGSIPRWIGGFQNLTTLSLFGNSLFGEIPPELSNLTQLTRLDIGANQLSGSNLTWIGGFQNLIELYVDGNQFAGAIPVELGDIATLQKLKLNESGLAGEIPHELSKLTQLTFLDLGANKLNGSIPRWIGGFQNLTMLSLYGNSITGKVPSELLNLTQLTKLELGSNKLSGQIPSWIGTLRNLTILDFGGNELNGSIPSWIGRSQTLTDLSLHGNSLTGEIPKGFSNLTQLTSLDLGANQLSGSIPSWLGRFQNLNSLGLSQNSLTGEIPLDLSNMTQLTSLDLGSNKLSGSVPPLIGRLQNLTYLRLSYNILTGEISRELSNLTKLTTLFLGSNRLSGSIPSSIATLQNLTQLSVYNNSLTGKILPGLSILTQLTYLYLGINNLVGEIPKELSNLTQMTELNLKSNQLSGSIPPAIGNLTKLQLLDLSSNFFTGVIPPELLTIPPLQTLTLGDNCLNVTELYTSNPNLTIDVQRNCFIGASFCKCGHGTNNTAKRVYIAVGVSAGTLLVGMTLLLLIYRRHKLKMTRSDGSQMHYVGKVKHYTLDEVKEATNNFTTILGAGAFAIVYYAKFKDGKEAAVKHFRRRASQDPFEEFEKEVDFLAKIHHRFLVNLVGYCTDQGHHMLLFEFMNKGNLKDYLCGREDSPFLTWEERVRIMISVGYGLEYLHFGRSPPLIHRDIKTANILLSSTELNPNSILADNDSGCPSGTTLIAKIADFGLGRETELDDSEAIRAYGHEYPKALHTRVAGSPGYIDPEYYMTSVLSSAVDVYSFGVVLLELITGKPALPDLLPDLRAGLSNDAYESWKPLADWAMPHLEKGEGLEIVDPRLETGSYDQEQLVAVAEQARLCIQKRAHLRPSMRDIVGVFTELFRVETKMVHPSLRMDYPGSTHPSDISESRALQPTRGLGGRTAGSEEYSSSQIEPR